MVVDVSDRLRSRVPVFLFTSGLCALVYQVAWLRLLRLVFGASTGASAATLGIFMGGLGLGSLVLGPRVDRAPNPLRLYGRLEVGIAIAAGLSPWAIYCVAWSYRAVGGTEVLGGLVGTLLRLLLSAVVLGVPTFLMGGTLPAAVRALTTQEDVGRRWLGLLYGTNTFGAVVGAGLTTFLFIEHLGIQKTVWLAALVNLIVAVWAGSLSRSIGDETPDIERAQDDAERGAGRAVPLFAVAAAGGVGVVFFVLEMVWYRMLGSILGGSTYTFGVILCVALAGVGLGGWLYSRRSSQSQPSLLGFSITCALEALLLLAPYALGDQLALLTQVSRDLRYLGFFGLVVSWFGITALVVFPASVVAGYQFPLLVGILGSGRRSVGRQIGLAYAANTAGAIVGSVAGGFLLLPHLGAPTVWRWSAVGLLGLAGGALLLWWRSEEGRPSRLWWPVLLGLAALGLLRAPGPGPYWRHNGIGAGRAHALDFDSSLTKRQHELGRDVAWEAEGLESSVALRRSFGYSFSVNGKTDGHTILDSGTQVMSPLVGAALHPDPKTGLVIGLGTGSSAGWLAAVPSIQQVDVYELERSILRVAEDSAPVNHDVLNDPKVSITIGDGRELLLTSKRQYDLIFSEPSNPYRAGISSLFTTEFYAAASQRLGDGGLFLQWLQAYEVDVEVVGTVVATLRSVFPHVELWQVSRGDLLLVASDEPVDHDLERVASRLDEEPFRSALSDTWGLVGVEGFYTGFVADSGFAETVASESGLPLNRDDLPVIEYGFARSLGASSPLEVERLRQEAQRRGWDVPRLTGGEVDWARVEELRYARWVIMPVGSPKLDEIEFENAGAQARARARAAFTNGDLATALQNWVSQDEAAVSRSDRLLVAWSMAATEHPDAEAAIRDLAEVQPTSAKAVEGLHQKRLGEVDRAVAAFVEAFERYRIDPWPSPPLMSSALSEAGNLAIHHPEHAARIHDALAEPFAVEMQRELRLLVRFRLIAASLPGDRCVETFRDYEPYPLWKQDFLEIRSTCYMAYSDPLASRAFRDLEEYLASQPVEIGGVLFGDDENR